MLYKVEVFDRFENYYRGVVVARGIRNRAGDERLRKLLEEAVLLVRQRLDPEGYREEPRIRAWREAYRAFGVNPNKFPPSVEALVRQVLKGRDIRSVNPVVDIFNYISLKYLLPSGADDLKKVKGDLRLTYARGGEIFVPFDRDEVDPPKPGEVIYRDDEKVLCRCWNWRQGVHTKIEETTEEVAINVDGLPPLSPDEVWSITEETGRLVKEFCGGEVLCFLLYKERPEVEILREDKP